MIKKEEVTYLAGLARIAMSDEESARIQKDLESIVGYISELNKAPIGDSEGAKKESLRNVMREDDLFHESGVYTEALLAAAPKAKDGYVVVRQIIER